MQCFDEPALDAALLLLPVVGFVEFDDERMLRTADAVRAELDANGFYHHQDDGLPGREGAFLACSFWLAECYARQGRLPEAREVFDRTMGAASPLACSQSRSIPSAVSCWATIRRRLRTSRMSPRSPRLRRRAASDASLSEGLAG